jgi:hypothetical protein
MFDVYVLGHGFMVTRQIDIPEKVYVRFYAAENTYYDGRETQEIINLQNEASLCERSSCKLQSVKEHYLYGDMGVLRDYPDLSSKIKIPDDKRATIGEIHLVEIAEGKYIVYPTPRACISLSTILEVLCAKFSEFELHWIACRLLLENSEKNPKEQIEELMRDK